MKVKRVMHSLRSFAPTTGSIKFAIELIDLCSVLVVNGDYMSPQVNPIHRLAPGVGVRMV
jgi:hypothetical protein